MPYDKSNMPEAVKGLPAHAQDIWIAAFNSAFDEYKGDEGKSNATAWAAIEKSGFKKNEKGEWVERETAPVKEEKKEEIKEEIKRGNGILQAMKLREDSPLKTAIKIKERVYRVELMNLEPPNVPVRGWSANGRYYSDRSLSSLARLLENRRSMATGHHDDGGLRELGGITRNVVKVDGKKILEADYKILHENPDWFATVLEEQIANPSANLVGLSINAKGKGYNGEVNGKKGEIVEDAIRAKGCDAVFDAAAGGKFKSLLEEKRSKKIMDMTLDELKEENPELIEQILKEEKTKMAKMQEELANYKKAEAESKEKELVSKLIKESKLTDEQSLGLPGLMAGKTEDEKKKIVEERIQLLKSMAAPQKIVNLSEKAGNPDPEENADPSSKLNEEALKIQASKSCTFKEALFEASRNLNKK